MRWRWRGEIIKLWRRRQITKIVKQGDKKKNEEKGGKDKYCGEGGNARMRRENNINVEEGKQ